ncbi:MAG TPA: hypothetical protein VFA44_07160 [Gaiellaceae bacterium]|nr:hypothetical protein [Gaiellaceae bacterium]
MLLPLAEHEAAPALSVRPDHVVTDQRAAPLVLDEQPEQLVDRRFGRAGDGELRLAHLELEVDLARRAFARRDLVSDWTALHADDLLQTVAPAGGGREAEEMPDRRPPDSGFERERGQVVALVNHDESIPTEEL